ncbi:NADP-dependent malic enzyme [Azospirillum sp. RWY-5-1]|uniref:NADP-dependent malic enzyme n=1 Tax=Azospirillum oleiclasticum TaxID=2735135 RepID=A0ABX2T3Z0_9PROT|nr:NADP-dependent malic enzyme [Azospirillum oleiclasticum]NYZ11856.1 NADP-dependent malic enzyme [Azospirillum oleiclasticum]NYZ19016.1 NADP-dependent malic enzyme [Azospirillum oleiclasticum]
MTGDLDAMALEYHRRPRPGKLAIVATKPMANQRDLALAYSPGVAAASMAIAKDPAQAAELTARANLVAVVTNGTAVLGLGNIGPLAAKPVMEGKAVLFKKFAGIDCFDIEIAETDVDALIDTIARLEPSFGAINLEDIAAPACFEVERRLRERMRIPVFHDDQHGTAIVVGAAVLNGLKLVGKELGDIKVVSTGGGAAGIACLDLLVMLGIKRENVWLVDLAGVVHKGRNEQMNPFKDAYARDTDKRTLDEVIDGADLFLGLSGPKVLKPEMVKRMATNPLILALANPEPEIMPDLAREVRPDAIIATGRSDFPNQVNNVLCFPFIFRGALDVGATTVTEEMKVAATHAVANLARAEPSDVVAAAYGGEELRFGPDYILPKPFDPRLMIEVSSAVAKAAMDSGVATRPIADFHAYREVLAQHVFRSGLVMKPVMTKAKQAPKRVVYTEGEDERVLRAAQVAVDEKIAEPILIGRGDIIEKKIAELGLRLKPGKDVEVIEVIRDLRYHNYSEIYRRLMGRRGVSPTHAANVVRTQPTVFGALMVRRGEADAMVCGTTGRYGDHYQHVMDIIGLRKGAKTAGAMNLLILEKGTYFLCDTYVNPDPTAEQVAEIARLAAEEVRRLGIEPKVALLSHSNFGSADTPSARKMRKAYELIAAEMNDLEVDGEMHADAALSEAIRNRVLPDSRLRGEANLLVMPTLDAANIAFNMLKVLGDAQNVGPMLLGAGRPVHIVTPSVTVRGLLNMTAVAVVDAQLAAPVNAAPRPAAE